MKHLALMSAICAAALVGCQKPAVEQTSGLDYTNLDTTARPGDDFARYATGHWIDNNPQPAMFPRWGSFTKLADDNTNQLAELIQGIAAQQNEVGTVAQKIGDLYNLAMDSTRLNAEGCQPLMPYLERLRSIQTREELYKLMFEEKDNLFFGIYNGADEKDSKNNALQLSQGGLSMGNRDYYLKDDEAIKKQREAFKEHIVNLQKLCGTPEEEAVKKMETLMRIQTEIAKVSKSMEELRIPEENYEKMTVAELTKRTGFDWDMWLKGQGYDQTTEVIVGQIVPITKGCEILSKAPVQDLKDLYEIMWISGASSSLSDAFTDENFAYNQKVTGQKEQLPRWKRAVGRVDGIMGEAVGQLYVEKYFPVESKERMLTLVKDLQKSLGERIKAQTWMSDDTKKVALEKLASFYVKIGYPDKWEDLSGLTVDPKLSLYENLRNISMFYWELDKKQHYNTPVDKDEWGMTPQTVNAYYNPTTNEICFPAGILQPPFFSKDWDDAANYGAIGVVIGHEMTHGFDDQGRQYDKDGNLRQWWADSDVEAFEVPAEQLAQYFDSLWVIPGELHSNGHQCLGENLADHGGLEIAFQALQYAKANGSQSYMAEAENGFTPEQRFFLSYANVWAGVCSEELLRRYAIMDVHSAGHLRINGGVAQCSAWYDAFDVKEGDALYVAPENRVNIW